MDKTNNKKNGLFSHPVKSIADIPRPKQINYETAQALAWEALEGADWAERAESSGSRWDESRKVLTIKLLGGDIDINASEKKVVRVGGDIQPWEAIISLHYLKRASGNKQTGKLISYKEIPDGLLYWPNFIARVHKILLKAYSSQPEKLLEFANVVGGEKADGGDVAIRITALPHVPVFIQLWKGDAEFSPDVAVLFDSSITRYLPTEDITVLSQMMAIKLMMAAKSIK
jgi:hypothetical protein